MSYTPYSPNVALVDDINNWSQQIAENVDLTAIGFGSQAQQEHIALLF